MATNYHILKDARRISIRLGTSEINGEILLQDPKNDLALVKLLSGADPLQIATLKSNARCLALGDPDTIKAGDRVFTLGYPLSAVLGSGISVGEGIVNKTVGPQDDPRMFQISIPIQPGNSGSPLFDPSGRVIGIITSTLSSEFLISTQGVVPQNVNFALKASYLRTMLALVPGESCPAPQLKDGKVFSARDLQERFGSGVVRIEVTK